MVGVATCGLVCGRLLLVGRLRYGFGTVECGLFVGWWLVGVLSVLLGEVDWLCCMLLLFGVVIGVFGVFVVV